MLEEHSMPTYRYGQITLEPAIEGMVTIRTQNKAVVDTAIHVGLLLFCSTFRPIQEHVDRYIRMFPAQGESRAKFEALLGWYIEQGILISEKEYLTTLVHAAEQIHITQEVVRGIELVAIPTANRPEELDRCLTSFIHNCKRFGRTPEFLVADDSNANGLEQNKKIISKHAKTYAGVITHLDYEARKKFAEKLALDSGTDREVVEFALVGDNSTPTRIGALRNTILLYAAGRKVLSIDDDVICQPRQVPGVNYSTNVNDLMMTSLPGQKTLFFDSYESAVSYFPKIDADYLGAHEVMLGKSVAEIITMTGKAQVLRTNPHGFSGTFLESMGKDLSGKKIAISHSGFVGHSWTRFHLPTMVLSHTDPKYSLWGVDEQDYLSHRAGLYLARVNTEYALYKGTSSVSLNISLDTSEFLPPFMPLYRSQDSVFGYMTHLFFPRIFGAYAPLLIEHKRHENRAARGDAVPIFTNIGKMTVYALLAASSGLVPKDVEDSAATIESLGKLLIVSAINNREELKSKIEKMIERDLAAQIEHLRSLAVHYHEGPEYWKSDLKKTEADITRSLESFEDIEMFWDVPEWHIQDDPWPHFFDWLVLYARVMVEWPKLYATNLTTAH